MEAQTFCSHPVGTSTLELFNRRCKNSFQSLGKRVFESRLAAIIGCMDKIFIVVTSTSFVTDAQTDLLECVIVEGSKLIGRVVGDEMKSVGPKGIDAWVKLLGSTCGDFKWGSTKK